MIGSASVPSMTETGVNAGSTGDYGGDFYWAGRPVEHRSGRDQRLLSGDQLALLRLQWSAACRRAAARTYPYAGIWVGEIILRCRDGRSFAEFAVGSVADQRMGSRRWNWPFGLTRLCGRSSLWPPRDGQPILEAVADKSAVWHQCDAAPITIPVDTAGSRAGSAALRIGGSRCGRSTRRQFKDRLRRQPAPAMSLRSG